VKLAWFLLNPLKNDSSKLLAGCLLKLTFIQNSLINSQCHAEYKITIPLPILSLKEDDLFIMNEQILLNKIYQCGFMTNYNYGYGRNIIYDFHEIELWLKQKLNKCKLIDTETVRQFDLFHYQFETFEFIETKIICLKNIPKLLKNENIFNIELKYLIDLYELMEEIVFDNDMYETFKNTSKFSTDINQDIILEEFDREIINNNELTYEPLKTIHIWISTLKRLLLRILSSKQEQLYDTALKEYLCRRDLWDQNIDTNEIENLNLTDTIKTKHAFIILEKLLNDQSKLNNKSSKNFRH
ncbi:unnamed protein product, partial [Didymodactylos carnosus]